MEFCSSGCSEINRIKAVQRFEKLHRRLQCWNILLSGRSTVEEIERASDADSFSWHNWIIEAVENIPNSGKTLPASQPREHDWNFDHRGIALADSLIYQT